MAHDVSPDGMLAPRGRPLFQITPLRLETYQPITGFDVSLDGQRFLFLQYKDTPPPPPPRRIHIVESWFEELKAKVPGR